MVRVLVPELQRQVGVALYPISIDDSGKDMVQWSFLELQLRFGVALHPRHGQQEETPTPCKATWHDGGVHPREHLFIHVLQRCNEFQPEPGRCSLTNGRDIPWRSLSQTVLQQFETLCFPMTPNSTPTPYTTAKCLQDFLA